MPLSWVGGMFLWSLTSIFKSLFGLPWVPDHLWLALGPQAAHEFIWRS